jgi:hypothetical protein
MFIPDPNPDFLPIPDPGVKKTLDPGSRSATFFVVIKYLRDHLCFRLAILSCLLDPFIFPGPSVQALAALREKARCVIMYAGMIPYRNVFTQHLPFLVIYLWQMDG